jgi:hypothetical protein
MPADLLTPAARLENARTLASALSLSADQAGELLRLSVLITADPNDKTALVTASEAAELLRRTIERVDKEPGASTPTIEIVIGAAPARSSARHLYVAISDQRLSISREETGSAHCADLPGLWALVCACYVTGAALSLALSQEPLFGSPVPLHVEFEQLGLLRQIFDRPLDLDVAYMAGAGAIGNGFLWAARHVEIAGTLHIVDDDQVSSGNLNRQVWFGKDDIGKFKATKLAELAQPRFPHLKLESREARLQDLPERSEGPWLKKLLVAVDSRRARRALQNEFPGEVFDASTTDIREIVVHHNRQVTDSACMSCIYEPDQEETSREAHIAEHFGVSVDEVRSERITEAAAEVIASRFAGLDKAALVGTAYDSLFKRLCAEAALKTSEGKRVLAPFAFVSVLAGALLLIEMFRQASPHTTRTNYWRLSPWHPPLSRRRVLRPKQPACAFCSNEIMTAVNRGLWGTQAQPSS